MPDTFADCNAGDILILRDPDFEGTPAEHQPVAEVAERAEPRDDDDPHDWILATYDVWDGFAGGIVRVTDLIHVTEVKEVIWV